MRLSHLTKKVVFLIAFIHNHLKRAYLLEIYVCVNNILSKKQTRYANKRFCLGRVVKNSVPKVPVSFLLLFIDYWITFYNFTLWRPNFTNKSRKKLLILKFCGWYGFKRRSFQTVSHKNFLTMNSNESLFLVCKMGQTKHKSLRTRDLFRFFARNCCLHFEHVLFGK